VFEHELLQSQLEPLRQGIITGALKRNKVDEQQKRGRTDVGDTPLTAEQTAEMDSALEKRIKGLRRDGGREFGELVDKYIDNVS
jgi:hypothetical protein